MTEDYSGWVGRQRRWEQMLNRSDLARLAAVLNVEVPPEEARPTWHWACFPELELQSRLGSDGHPRRGDFLPPIAAPRRMFAAADVRILAPLEAGQRTEIVETIASIETKAGRSGALTFVELDRVLSRDGGVRLKERQTFVYRDAGTGPWRAPAPEPATIAPEWREAWTADPVLLFRYSAATFNSHRIHYDRAYATGEEGYPGLVVHGPLLATLLAESVVLHCGDTRLVRFAFQARRPVFEGEAFYVCGRRDGAVASLWIEAHDGGVAMTARAELT